LQRFAVGAKTGKSNVRVCFLICDQGSGSCRKSIEEGQNARTWGVPLTIVTVVGCGDPFQRTTQVDCGTGVGTPASELCKLTAIVKGWPPAGMEIGNVVRLHVCAKETLQASGKKQNKSLFIRKLEFNTSEYCLLDFARFKMGAV
jgi:hypothetical protein